MLHLKLEIESVTDVPVNLDQVVSTHATDLLTSSDRVIQNRRTYLHSIHCPSTVRSHTGNGRGAFDAIAKVAALVWISLKSTLLRICLIGMRAMN